MDEKHVLHRIVTKEQTDKANGDVNHEAFMPSERDEQPDGSCHLSVIAGSVKQAEKACRKHAIEFKKNVAGSAALYHSDVETIEIMKTKLKVINDGKKDSAHRSIVIPPPAASMKIKAHHKNIAKRLCEQAKKNGDEHGFYYVYIAA